MLPGVAKLGMCKSNQPHAERPDADILSWRVTQRQAHGGMIDVMKRQEDSLDMTSLIFIHLFNGCSLLDNMRANLI
jgi:hypothetical protein